MSNFSTLQKHFLHLKTAFYALFVLIFLCLGVGCKKEMDYLPYVSELRSNILLAEQDNFSLRIYAVKKEQPYIADGIPQECSSRTEVYLVAPEGTQNCHVNFSYNGQNYGGEMSFDNVKTEYYFACTLDISKANELPCRIVYGDKKINCTARSVRTEQSMSPTAILQSLQNKEADLFAAMTDKYGFTGEIYLRLIYEDAPYYYVGLIERNGNIHAFLINAESGKILAKRKT